jgi:ABC-2 type transport system ATP-binding protein
VASVRIYPIPAREPGPARVWPASEGRPAAWVAELAESHGLTVALTGLDLHGTARGNRVLLGPNGAGKSATTGLLLGLLHPDRGQVQVHDRSSPRAAADGLVGATLQDAGLMPGVWVGELLAMVRGLYPRAAASPSPAWTGG